MKILFVATVQSHIAQFHLGAISLLKEHGYEIHVAARNNLAEKNGLQLKNVDNVFDIQFDRGPFAVKNISAYKQLANVIDKGNYDIIHCNTPVGGILTRLAARKARKRGTQVIYTAHGFHFYKGAPLKNWLMYYPIEKVMAHFTDKLVTITNEDYELAKKKFSCSVFHVHGVGVNTLKYGAVDEKRAMEFKKELGLKENYVILCTGELNENKNQKTLINAMPKILKEIPNAILLLAGNGPSEEKLKESILELGLKNEVKLIGYHTDLEKYVHMCDLVVSASYREGLPLNIMEGMYSKKAIIASINRGHKELVEDDITGYLVKADNVQLFADKIIQVAQNSSISKNFAERGYLKVQDYLDKNILKELKEVYCLS